VYNDAPTEQRVCDVILPAQRCADVIAEDAVAEQLIEVIIDA